MIEEIAVKTDHVAVNSISSLFETMEQALKTYSNVHRGSGHKSMVTTHLFEESRNIVLDYLGLKNKGYTVIFCTPARADAFIKLLNGSEYKMISSKEFGLPLGVRAVALKNKDLPKGIPFQTGGGTTKLYSKNWVIWANGPDKFEAGTPAIVNIIAFARALMIIRALGKDIFKKRISGNLSVDEILYNDELKDFSGKELLQKLRKTMLGSGLQVPVSGGMKPFINLDNSASTPAFSQVWNA
ncbi:MAG: aminotransferase class V-fold PLP-dependent enzyme, partial [Bacteroidales bacterium]|nr:aminotransferase class V-fold PLP-dependent enzyme [Bacteroidales bacterium]